MQLCRHLTYTMIFGLMSFLWLHGDARAEEKRHTSHEREQINTQMTVNDAGTSANAPTSAPPPRPVSGKTVTEETSKHLNRQKSQPVAPPDPNRRWIMKQRDHRKLVIKPKAAKPLKWKSAIQQNTCQSLEEKLAVSFEKAQFYSVQGDRCKTAQFARAFLKTTQQCRSKCPEKFLAYHGFGDQVVRNMNQLQALGQESCLGTPKQVDIRKTVRK